jgi:diguanylate cyclase (GGDEF)-like protein/PAS domain S-box-containing protein
VKANPLVETMANILVVDDLPDNLRLLNQILGQYYHVRLAPSASSGLAAARTSPPDLILLDIMLPETSGYDVARKLKADPLTADVPIIFISALDDTESKLEGFKAGGVDYVTKPFQEMEVLARVNTHLAIRSLYKQAQQEIAERKLAEERYRLLAENTSDVIWVFNLGRNQFTYMSPSVEHLCGYTEEEMMALCMEAVLEAESLRLAAEIFRRDAALFMANPQTYRSSMAELQQWCKDGTLIWVEISIRFRYNASGEVEVVGVSRQIEQRKKAERELRISEERHRLLADNSVDLIWTMTMDRRVTYISPAIQHLLGFTSEEFLRLSLDEMFTPESWAIMEEGLIKAQADVQAGRPVDFRAKELEERCKDGSTIWVEITATGIYNQDGEFVELLGITHDISRRKRAEQELKNAHDALAAANQALQEVNVELSWLAKTDPLTGIWNRRYFQEVANDEIAKAQRYNQPLSMVMFDIDHFKSVNDQYGHKAGDRVLVELCQRVERNLRATDRLARWGGEEFVVLLPHCGAAEALALAEKLRALIGTLPFDEVGSVTASFGVAVFQAHESADEWFKRADLALYEAKTAGRNAARLGS